jgi:YegS/Rv2252/BmrU family lipid kinase
MKSLIILIANPAAQKASDKKVAMASYYLQSKGYEVDVLFTHKRGDAEALARDYLNRVPSRIIAAGGDGTFNEVVNGIAGSEIPMAILPLGTTNVLARELDVPENVQGAMERALRKRPARISLGKITLTDSPQNLSRYFILMAGIGYDGMAVRGTSETMKKLSGKGAYVFSGIKTFLNFHPGLLSFSVDGKHYEGYSGIIGNAAKYGGPFSVTPDAQLSDPALYVCIFKGRKRVDVARYVFGFLTGTHLKYRDLEYLRAEQVEITGNAHIQIDGDYFGMTPAKVEIIPNALSLVYE